MTNNDNFKKEASELLDKVISFKSRYLFHARSKDSSGADLFERDLRMMLSIARTDEENEQQRRRDTMC